MRTRYTISSLYIKKWLSYDINHVKNRHFSRHFGLHRDFPHFIFYLFWRFKKRLRVIFAFFAKIWLKNMYHGSKSRFFCLTFFTWWPNMTLNYTYYGHKAQEMILENVRDTIHADSLALFELNIEILLADVTKPKSRTFCLWPDLRRHWWPRGH